MKKLTLSLTLIFNFIFCLVGYAQIPQGINYQAIVRDAGGNPVIAGPIPVVITITNGSGNFTETHNVTPNQFGLVNLVVGSIKTAEFQAFDFSVIPTTISVDAAGNNLGVQTLQSVPYSLKSAIADSVQGVDLNTLEVITAGSGLTKVGSNLRLGGVMAANTTLSSADDMFFDGTGGGAIYFENGTVEISSLLRIQDGNQAIGKVLTSDGIGNASWQVPSSEIDPKVGTLTSNFIPKWSTSSMVNSRLIDNGIGFSVGKGVATSYGLDVQSANGIVSRFTGTNTYAAVELNTIAGNYAYYRFLNNGTIGGGIANYSNTIRLYYGSDLIGGLTLNSSSDLGVGVISPVNKLDVEGAVAIGATYSGTSTAPLNGLIVEGKVGLGTNIPSAPLDIQSTATTTLVVGMTQNGTYASSTGYTRIRMENGTSTENWLLSSHAQIGSETTTNANFNIYYSGLGNVLTALGNGNVGIGKDPGYTLDVQTPSGSSVIYTGRFENLSTAATTRRGIYALVTGTGGTSNIGVYGRGTGGSSGNYGVYGEATGAGAYGVYCSGNMAYTGTLTDVSDIKFKKDIQDYKGALDQVTRLRPVTYNYKAEEYSFMGFDMGQQIGFVAQEVETVLPSLVIEAVHPGDSSEDGEGSNDPISYKSLSYIGLIPVLTKAIQEQQAQIELLKKELELLKK